MIILTARIPKLKFPQLTATATAVCCGLLVFSLAKHPYQATIAPQNSSSPQVTELQSSSDRLEYLAQWGWEVLETPLLVETLLIPEYLDQNYEEYIQLQVSQGFPHLSEYCGETIQRYSYEITNYPTGAVGMQVNLLIHDKEVLAGEVLSPSINGIFHGLAMPERE